MKKQKMVYYANGENRGTYGFLCFAENFTGDLTEKTEKFVSWDCNIYVECDKYKLCELEIPDWMSENEWKWYEIDYKYTIGLTGLSADELSEVRFHNLRKLGEKYKYFIGWLMKKNTKNAYMLSIRDQVISWLDTQENRHAAPLSEKQWEAATRHCPLWEAKSISTRLYYNR